MIATTSARPAVAQSLDTFLDATVRSCRDEARAARTSSARSRAEAALVLLTDYRLHGLDEASFDALLARMATGRSPVALLSTTPSALARDLAARWRAHREAATLARA